MNIYRLGPCVEAVWKTGCKAVQHQMPENKIGVMSCFLYIQLTAFEKFSPKLY